MTEDFVRKEIIPVAAEYDRTGEYPWPIVKKAHEIGLMNHHIPKKYGGMEMGTLDSSVLVEKLAYGCSGIGTAMEANGLGDLE